MDGKFTYLEETLFNDGDLKWQLNHKGGSRGLYWNVFKIDLGTEKSYNGQWKSHKNRLNDTIEGLGTLSFKDGSKYQGMIKQQKFEGKGKMTHANEDIYWGEWQNGKAHGKGVFIDQEGMMYDGEWENDQYHGQGTETWKYNEIVYSGSFVNGKKTGQGVFTFDGNKYEGEFADGQFQGKGKYMFAESEKVY